MKRDAACPDFSLLSQFLDYELEEDEVRQLSQHLKTCPECRNQAAQLQQLEGAARTKFVNSPDRRAVPLPSPECLSPMQIVVYVHSALPTIEQQRCEKHMQTCDGCLREVVDTVSIMATLASTKDDPLPAALDAQVATQWQESPRVTISRLVVQFAQQSAQLLETHLVAPLFNVREIRAPQLTFRSEGSATALTLEIGAEQVTLRVTIVQEENNLALRLLLLGPEQQPLVGRRLFLRRQGKSIFSAKTDKTGRVQISRVEPRQYEVECPEMGLIFQLELHT